MPSCVDDDPFLPQIAIVDVSPYHILIEEAHGSPAATRRIIQAGFDVDVCGLSNKNEMELPPPDDYALGYAELKKIGDGVSQHDQPVGLPEQNALEELERQLQGLGLRRRR